MPSARVAIGPAFGEFGGVSQHVRNLARASRHEPDVFRLPAWSLFHPAWSAAFGFLEERRIRFPDPWIVALARKLRGADLVHLHAYPFWIDAFLRPNNPDARYVLTVHQVFRREDVPPAAWPRHEALNRNLVETCRRADAVVSVAAWQARVLAEAGVEAEVIPNGVDFAGVQDGRPERFREAYGIDGPFYLSAAALLRYKRPELLAALARERPDRRVVAFGRGMTREGLTRYLGAPPPDNLVPLGEVPRRDLVDAYHGCRAFVLASSHDTFPTALLEAMGAGRPVVASRSAGPGEIVADRREGFLFEPDDPGSLVAAADRAWDAAPSVGEAARAKAAQYGWPRVAERVDALYDKLLG